MSSIKKRKSGNEPTPTAVVAGGEVRLSASVLTVLHVEDDPNDALLLQAAARKAGVSFILHSVRDAEQAFAYLDGRGAYADREKYHIPALILLDLKMPCRTGFEVLKWVRSRPQFGHVPVVILSGSEFKDDFEQAYAMGANSYQVKPLGFQDLVAFVKNLNAVWLSGPAAGQLTDTNFVPHFQDSLGS